MMIKICGLQTEAEVAHASAAGVDAAGFVFVTSVRKVTAGQARDACRALKKGIRRIAVLRHPPQTLVDEVIRDFAPDVLQTDVEDLAGLSLPESLDVWPVYRQGVSEPGDEESFLYEGRNSGTGETVDWSLAARYADHGRMILAGGLAPDNVGEAIRQVKPWGVDVSSGVESSPGVKDPDKMTAFVEAARAAEKNP